MTNAALSALFSEALERSSRPDNTRQWLMPMEFPFGSRTCIHTEEQCPEPRPPSCSTCTSCSAWHRSLARPCRWRLWPGEAQVVITPGVCVCDLSQAYTALPQTRPHLSPMKQAARAVCTLHGSQRQLLCTTFPPRAKHSVGTWRTLTHVILPQSRKVAMSPLHARLLS